MASRNLSIPIVTAFNDAGLKKAQAQLENLGNKVSKLSTKALKAGAAFAAFQGGRALVDFASGAIEQSRDLERNMNGLQAVFGELTPRMVEFSEQAVKMGLSQSEAAKSVTFIGSVLKQSGFALGETAELTERLIRLGTDLSITYGYDVQEALLGMTALFRGEYDPIEKFGVAMKQSEIDAVKAARGLGSLTGAAERLADQQIRVELLFQRSADAQGMYEKSSDSLFVAQQNLEATFKNMQATAGRELTPAFANLTLAITPLVEKLTPALAQILQKMVPVVTAFAENTDQLQEVIDGLANGIIETVSFLAAMATVVGENIVAFRNITFAVATFTVASKAIMGVVTMVKLLTGALTLSVAAVKALRIALISTGIGAIIAGLGFVISKFVEANDKAEDFSSALPALNLNLRSTEESAARAAYALELFKKGLSPDAIDRALDSFVYTPPQITVPGTGGTGGDSSGEQARDYIKEFYDGLKDEVKKQEAKVKLENLGATAGLIDSILGSGEEWEKVFDDVIKKGAASVAAAQLLFNQTASGLDEITKRVEEANAKLKAAYEEDLKVYEDAVKAFESFKTAALEAGDSMDKFLQKMGVLPTFETAMGRFESQVVSDLASIEEKLNDAFDNGYLLEESYKNLQGYARSEYIELQRIAKQRDVLLNRRNLAESLIKDVRNATVAAGSLVNILQNTQTETQKINMTKVVQDTVQAGKNMKDFRVTIISDFVEPIEEAASKSEMLVDGFRAVVERTRLFVDNLKALKQLGLDPLLFNQLVEAGVEAGGETAQALIDGGADTITEVNSLFGELDALGQELGEQTAQVMYGEGQEFVNGIISGLDSMLEDLETTATTLANSFVTAFSAVLAEGVARAIAAAQAAMPAAPSVPDYTPLTDAIEDTKTELEEIAEVIETKVPDIIKPSGGGGTGGSGGGGKPDPEPEPPKISPVKPLSESQLSAIRADNRATSSMYTNVGGFGFTGGYGSTRSPTINLTVQANTKTQGAAAGQAIVKELNRYNNSSGATQLDFFKTRAALR